MQVILRNWKLWLSQGKNKKKIKGHTNLEQLIKDIQIDIINELWLMKENFQKEMKTIKKNM